MEDIRWVIFSVDFLTTAFKPVLLGIAWKSWRNWIWDSRSVCEHSKISSSLFCILLFDFISLLWVSNYSSPTEELCFFFTWYQSDERTRQEQEQFARLFPESLWSFSLTIIRFFLSSNSLLWMKVNERSRHAEKGAKSRTFLSYLTILPYLANKREPACLKSLLFATLGNRLPKVSK